MSKLSDALARVVIVERERDAAREEIVKLRDAILALANKCYACKGTGFIKVPSFLVAAMGEKMPCVDCKGLRRVLE